MPIPILEAERIQKALGDVDADLKTVRIAVEAVLDAVVNVNALLPLSEAKVLAVKALVQELTEIPPPPPRKWFGGQPGRKLPDGSVEEVIEGKEITSQIPSKTRNVCLLDCTFLPGADWIMEGEYWNFRILGGYAKGLKPKARFQNNPKFIYVNNGQAEVDSGIVIDGLRFDAACEGLSMSEFKATAWTVANIQYDKEYRWESGDVRARHGARGLVYNCPLFRLVKLRGWDHMVLDCPKAIVFGHTGNLPSKAAEWRPLWVDGSMRNWQHATDCYAENVARVSLGVGGSLDPLYKCSRFHVPPGTPITRYPGLFEEPLMEVSPRPAWFAERMASVA